MIAHFMQREKMILRMQIRFDMRKGVDDQNEEKDVDKDQIMDK